MPLQKVKTAFNELFHTQPEACFFAPGRVNLIGEHIDYNGGLVFPCAITKGTYAAISPRKDNAFNVCSLNFKGTMFHITTDDLTPDHDGRWTNYLKGVLSILVNKGFTIPHGFDMVLYGDLPNGAGLSSSASLEMLFCKIFNDYYDLNLSPVGLALIGKQVENEYIGVNSGIMDQFAIALGQENSALLLDCSSLVYHYIPFAMEDHVLVIMNTNKRRTLADSKYNERYAQCQESLGKLKSHFSMSHLCDLSSEQLPEVADVLNDPILFARTKHAVTENERVLAATNALKNSDFETFGKLLTGSHLSLKADYEVTGVELDTLVDEALANGALGARMTGAGFGGCAICLVHKDKAADLIDKVGASYKKAIGYEASFYEASINGGPCRLA